MTIGEAIKTVDRLRPNRFGREDKVKWLSELDGQIWCDLISTHEQSAKHVCEGWIGMQTADFSGYDTNAPDDTELMVKFPHDALYLRWLESQIDLNNMEIGKYNNSRSLFNNAYLTYTDWYNRTHMPKGAGGFRFTEGRKAGEKDALST